jgi:hypothetical protein
MELKCWCWRRGRLPAHFRRISGDRLASGSFWRGHRRRLPRKRDDHGRVCGEDLTRDAGDARVTWRLWGRKSIQSGKLRKAEHWDKDTHSVSFWDGFHRLVNDNKRLSRLVGASLAWFLMDAAYYRNTVSSPTVLNALNSDHTLLQKTLTQFGAFVVFASPGYAVSALTIDRLAGGRFRCWGLA